ncbi:uncharacterized protein PgNI_00064, partial [Pyricularia grisea]|uniref:Fungal-type protein kinase domain-containing protein n=1 Tax=Pyricularia grisea TaxID=148305 RepID=A0A6P8BGG5_PYRGI
SPANVDTLSNRVHRRVILRNYGKPIYKTNFRSALFAPVKSCIEGHESLRMAGFLHRNISTNNLIINEDTDSLFWPYFLINLDLGVRKPRMGVSGAKGKTGKVISEFNQWNYISMDCWQRKRRGKCLMRDFIKFVEENFTPYYRPLVIWVNNLRKAVFPNGGRLSSTYGTELNTVSDYPWDLEPQ